MKSCELVTFITAVACNMASCYTEDELTIFSAIFSQLGDTLATILSNETLLESAKNSNQEDTISNCKEDKNLDENDLNDMSNVKSGDSEDKQK
ncbi:MAG: hypothetical protein K0S61_2985 [Anaerocolumna sp.]|jgi:hypothetical protein|nr:hypothetical protein [Anaerocolumna sp.]